MRIVAVIVAWLALVGCTPSAPDPTDERTSRAQEILAREVPSVEPAAVKRARVPQASAVEAGQALATIRIPRLGESWKWVVVEGTSPDDLARGIGHFTGTALPGERGNTSYAGHRNGWGDPLLDFETLRRGDEVIIEQGKARWTYVAVGGPEIIEAADVWVLDVPGPGRWLTITTCWPKYGNEKRMFLRARLVTV